MRKKQSLGKAQFVGYLSVLLLFAVAVGAFLLVDGRLRLAEEQRVSDKRFIAYEEEDLRNKVQSALNNIIFLQGQTEAFMEKELQGRVDEACAIAWHLYEQNKDSMPRAEIEALIREALRAIRFSDGRGYFFATRLDGEEVLFADRPEMEGRNLLDTQDTEGRYVIRDMIDIAKGQGAGFYYYTWTKPGSEGRSYPKLAYVRLFKPFNWFIGTGEYVDDAEHEMQQQALRLINGVPENKDVYNFILAENGDLLLHPDPRYLGKNLWNIRDDKGIAVVQGLISQAKKPDGGFLWYGWRKVGSDKETRKLSHTRYYAPWKWTVGTGVFMDQMEADRKEMAARYQKKVRRGFASLALFLLMAAAAAIVLAGLSSRRAQKEVDTLRGFFGKSEESFPSLAESDFSFREFSEIAKAASRMNAEREKAVRALSEKERMMSLLFSNLPGMAFRCGPAPFWAFEFVSEGSEELLGFSPEELTQETDRSFCDFIHPEDRPRVTKAIEEALIQGKPYLLEYRIKDALGREKWVWESGRGVYGADGRVTAVEGFLTDITDSMKTRLALKESEQRFRDLADLLPGGIFEMGPSGNLDYVNQGALAMFGYTEKDLEQGISALSIMAGADRERAAGRIGEVLSGAPPVPSEYLCRKKDGTEFPAIIHTSIIVRDGKRSGLRGVVLDVTLQKKLESDLRQAQKMDALGRLAGGIAHDFNNILAAILGYTEMSVLKAGTDPAITHNLGYVLRAAERGKELVRQILLFSRREEPRKDPVEIKAVVLETATLLRATLPASIRMDLDIRAIGSVRGSAVQIQQVLVNLCTNAARAMTDIGGLLHVELSDEELDVDTAGRHPGVKPGPYVKLTVADTGRGISPEIKERIFEPFFTTGGPGEGSGMGLSVVHGIVSAHGGFLTVYSEPGRGAAFNVFFPSSGEMVEPRASRDTEPPPQQHDRGSALFVDDEPALKGLGERMLSRLGFTVTAFTESPKALAAFAADPSSFDILVTDQTMPDMTGSELAEAVLAIRPDMPVVLCTGYSEAFCEDKALAAGMGAFVMKPATLRRLSDAVDSALEKKGKKVRERAGQPRG